MANREACELWIEQRSGDLAEEGKDYEEIGRIVSKEVASIFEAAIKARTIAQRARRSPIINSVTNVTKESNTETITASYKPEESSVTHPPTDRGGAREGAGRRRRYNPYFPRSIEAVKGAHFAISMLKRIPKKDPNRDRELTNVLNWIMESRKGGQYEK